MAELSQQFEVHRQTISKHLEARAVRRRGSRPSFTEDDLPELAALYQAGDSYATIAARHDVDPATVLRWLKKAGVPPRPR